MKKKKEISDIFIMCQALDFVALSKRDKINGEILLFKDCGKTESIYEPAFRMYSINNELIFQNFEGAPIKKYDGDIHSLLNQECYMTNIAQDMLIVSQKEDNGYIDFILMPDMNLLMVPFFPKYATYGFLINHWGKRIIKKYNIQSEPQFWQINISTYGQYINLKGDEQPNEIDDELMGYDNLLFIPLRGGQLLALDVVTGGEVWMLQQHISGRYGICKDKIYKSNADALYEIDGKTGEIQMVLNKRQEKFAPRTTAGPMNIYEDVIVLSDMLSGMLYLIDRITFRLIDEISVGKCLVNSNDSIVWHNNTLYVLDIENTLHIFEKG